MASSFLNIDADAMVVVSTSLCICIKQGVKLSEPTIPVTAELAVSTGSIEESEVTGETVSTNQPYFILVG